MRRTLIVACEVWKLDTDAARSDFAWALRRYADEVDRGTAGNSATETVYPGKGVTIRTLHAVNEVPEPKPQQQQRSRLFGRF
jgi:hypothetical protein